MVSNTVKGVQDYDRYIYYKDNHWYVSDTLGTSNRFKSIIHEGHHHDDPTGLNAWQVWNGDAYEDHDTLKFEYETTHIGR